MTDRTDHKAEAEECLDDVSQGSGNLPDDWCGASDDERWMVMATLAEAQVHATLYAAEQARIANLIALRSSPQALEDAEVATGLGYMRVEPAAALGVTE